MEGEPPPMAMMGLSPPGLGGPESSPQPRDRTRRAAHSSAATRLGELVSGFGSRPVLATEVWSPSGTIPQGRRWC